MQYVQPDANDLASSRQLFNSISEAIKKSGYLFLSKSAKAKIDDELSKKVYDFIMK